MNACKGKYCRKAVLGAINWTKNNPPGLKTLHWVSCSPHSPSCCLCLPRAQPPPWSPVQPAQTGPLLPPLPLLLWLPLGSTTRKEEQQFQQYFNNCPAIKKIRQLALRKHDHAVSLVIASLKVALPCCFPRCHPLLPAHVTMRLQQRCNPALTSKPAANKCNEHSMFLIGTAGR